jgi:hypothetical protein
MREIRRRGGSRAPGSKNVPFKLATGLDVSVHYDEVPWTDLDALRALAESRELDPHPKFLLADRFELVRLVNERILALDPADYRAAMRISRVHLYWAKASTDASLATHHYGLRRLWLHEALHRDPPPPQRRTILGALGGWRPSAAAEARAHEASRTIAVTTVPTELVRLARSLRESDPRLPHLALLAANRTVTYADHSAGGNVDPDTAPERFMARSSLGACLRKMRRPADAIKVAEETIALNEHHPVGWTVLIAATRDLGGGAAAVEVVESAIAAVGLDAAVDDQKFASAAAAAYRAAHLNDHADVWQAAVLDDVDPEPAAREAALDHAQEFAKVLRDRNQSADAELLEGIVRRARMVSQRGSLIRTR